MLMGNDETELLTIEQLCERLFISPTTAYKLLQSGEIKGFKVGTWKIPAMKPFISPDGVGRNTHNRNQSLK